MVARGGRVREPISAPDRGKVVTVWVPRGTMDGMTGTRYEFEAELWRWEARTDSWVFAALPEDVSDEIAELPLPPAGFGSVRVEVTLGAQRWSTSVFPDAGRKTYVLPVKAAVRRAEGVDVGDRVRIGVQTML
jgi:hypothetical protein